VLVATEAYIQQGLERVRAIQVFSQVNFARRRRLAPSRPPGIAQCISIALPDHLLQGFHILYRQHLSRIAVVPRHWWSIGASGIYRKHPLAARSLDTIYL
jgi:hypothetical protein